MSTNRKRAASKPAGPSVRSPIMHPISMLPVIRGMIDGQVADDAPLLRDLRHALTRPGAMDDHTVARTSRVYQERLEFIPIFRQQLATWSADPGNASLRSELDRLSGQVSTMEANAQDILAIAGKLKDVTIEQILKKSDVELGVDALRRGTTR